MRLDKEEPEAERLRSLEDRINTPLYSAEIGTAISEHIDKTLSKVRKHLPKVIFEDDDWRNLHAL